MKILLAASEVAPIIKLGGLGDVVGSLPKALEKLSAHVDVIVPYFPIAKFSEKHYKSIDLEVPFNNNNCHVEVYKTKLPESNVDVFLLKCDDYFVSGGVNAFANNISETEMFSFFSRAVVEFIKCEFNTYDIIHCNDWHTGLITHILEEEMSEERPKTLFTIHNLLYQGIGDAHLVKEAGITLGEHPIIDWDLEDKTVNLMLQGITSSDYVNTVSPSYAKEILTEEYGGSFAEILKSREARLSGILNGIDVKSFSRHYDVSDFESKKAEAKLKLQKRLCLEEDANIPLFSFISRLDPNQKGLDILRELIPEVISRKSQFVILGTGDKAWEATFIEMADKLGKENMSVNIMFDNTLAQEIYAGSDFLLAPSKYEPCGLIQMIAMWYGTLPIVHNVGGLKDSVKNGVNGFTFDEYSGEAAIKAAHKALEMHGSKDYHLMITNAMREDFSWDKSAKEYLKLYEKMTEEEY